MAKPVWNLDQLKARALDSLRHHRDADAATVQRLLDLLRYGDGDYSDEAPFVLGVRAGSTVETFVAVNFIESWRRPGVPSYIHVGKMLPVTATVGEDVEMTLTKHEPNLRPPYQRLLGDGLRGVGELYGRDNIVDAQSRIVEPILDNATPVCPYHPGTWGPEEAEALIGADGPWRNPNIAAEPFT